MFALSARLEWAINLQMPELLYILAGLLGIWWICAALVLTLGFVAMWKDDKTSDDTGVFILILAATLLGDWPFVLADMKHYCRGNRVHGSLWAYLLDREVGWSTEKTRRRGLIATWGTISVLLLTALVAISLFSL